MPSLDISPDAHRDRIMSTDTYVDATPEKELDSPPLEKEESFHKETGTPESEFQPPADWLERFKAEYSGHHDGRSETLPPGADLDRTFYALFTMDEATAVDRLRELLVTQKDDYTFDTTFEAYIADLIQGHTHCAMELGDWTYEVCKTAGKCFNWSIYTEVRAVTLPYDNVNEACESIRAYILGMFWVCACTGVNTFFFPRQPAISIPGAVVQLLLVPMGRFCAYVLPDWGFTIFGSRYTLNPGPWTSKEQLFSTIIYEGASTIGNSTGLLVLKMPMFFNAQWAGFGYAVLLALANQGFGLGFAGILRRLTVYPIEAVWPNTLPTLALNRTLIAQDNKRENINGWRLSRYRCFLYTCGIFIIWYWIPNVFVGCIRLFNWMTWIAPNNKNLAIVTGSYGGMGFNPLSTLDPLTSGANVMQSPFFAQLQQYIMRAISGVIILILYYANVSWGAYMPINSNGVFDNTLKQYNVSRVLNEDNTINIDAYKTYGPPYYSTANLYVTGANFVYYTFTFVYVFVKYWRPLKKAFVGMVKNTLKRRSVYTGFDDASCRLMRSYPEVPEWWYGILFVVGFAISIVAVAAFPTQTPWWSILLVAAIGGVLCVPWVIVESIANTAINLAPIWQVLPGLWFPGQPLPQLMLLMLGHAFTAMAGSFTNDLKFGHYARIPPRAMFRGHTASIVVNAVVYCAILSLLGALYDKDATMCQWDNKQYMVCAGAHGVWSSVIFFGAFGTNNMFKLYPQLPMCFLYGAILGAVWIGIEKIAPALKSKSFETMAVEKQGAFDRYFWNPAVHFFNVINPAIALSGATQWAGNLNLTYGTLGIYIAFVFQYYLKRKYTAWWGKYSYLIFAGLSVGVAISGLIGTLVFSFGVGQGVSFKWGGNTIQQEGWDYKFYNNQGGLLDLPEEGYFGLPPEEWPLGW